MSFQKKIDFCGLSANEKIVCKSHDFGRANSVATVENDDGDTVKSLAFGEVLNPKNSYALTGDMTDWEIVLGGVTEVNLGTQEKPEIKRFALKSVAIATAKGAEVGISADCEEVPANVTPRKYTVTIAKLLARNKAQILNDLFTVGADDKLQSANYTIAIELNQTTVDGVRVMTDGYGGKISCAVKLKTASANEPVVTAAAEGVVVVTSAPTSERPDSDFTSASATVTKYLTADADAPAPANADAPAPANVDA